MRSSLAPPRLWLASLRKLLPWAIFTAALFLAIFRLPFFFPPAQVSSSPAYEAGFSTRISIVATLLGALIMAAHGWIRRAEVVVPLPVSSTAGAVSRKLVASMIALYSVLFWFLTIGQLNTADYLGDTRYFLDALIQITRFARRPYADFDFVYGPLMLYLPLWLHRLPGFSGISLEACTYALTFALNLWGLDLLAKCISKTIASRFANWLYAFVALAFIPSIALPHGCLIRYISPFAALIFLHTIERRVSSQAFSIRTGVMAAYMFIAVCLIGSFSPEMGIVFALGAAAFCVFCTIATPPRGVTRDLAPACSIAIAVALCAILLGSNPSALLWFRSLAAFSKGGMSFVIVPSPIVVAYLVALLFCAFALGGVLRRWRASDALWVALAIAAFCTMPALLGLITFGHVLFYGIGVFLLAFSILATRPIAVQRSVTLGFGLLILAMHVRAIQVDAIFVETLAFNSLAQFPHGPSILANVISQAERIHIASGLERIAHAPAVSIHRLPPDIGQDCVATPWGTDKITDRTLLDAGVYHPEYYLDFINVSLPESEPIKIAALNECQWALVPTDPPIGNLNLPLIRLLTFYPVSYPSVRRPYVPGKELYAYLLSHYEPAVELGGYQLYRRVKESAASAHSLPR